VPSASSLPISVAIHHGTRRFLYGPTDHLAPTLALAPKACTVRGEIPGKRSPRSREKVESRPRSFLLRKITSLSRQQWPARLLALTPGKDSPKQRQKRHHHVRTPKRRKRRKTSSPTCYNASATRSTNPQRHRNNSHQPKQAQAPRMARHPPHNPTRPMVPRRHRRRHNNRLPSPSPTRTPEAQGNVDYLPQRLDHLLHHRLHA
jgi:hypothetical protein